MTADSVVVTPVLCIAKQQLGESWTRARRPVRESRTCRAPHRRPPSWLGLALTAAVGWWWLDPGIGLALAAVAVYEGLEAWRGEDSC